MQTTTFDGGNMAPNLLTAREAADRLGISRETLYDWLRQSNASAFVLRGQPVTIAYFQGGARGQGRILLEPREVDRLLQFMRVQPQPKVVRHRSQPATTLQHITKLGRPDD